MGRHSQTWVKVNALVDAELRELVSILSSVPQLQTIDSCQGDTQKAGWVYFYYGAWERCAELVFGTLATALRGLDGFSLSVEVFNGSDPLGKIGFRAEALPKLTSTLKQAFSHRRFRCSYGKQQHPLAKWYPSTTRNHRV